MDEVKSLPEVSFLRSILHYDPNSGHLYWLARTPEMFNDGAVGKESACQNWNRRYAGKRAFQRRERKGYLVGEIKKVAYKAHRIAWAIAHGREPRFIDHINGDKTDNRLCNLRDTDKLGNNRNQKRHSTNRCGVTGVCQVSAHPPKWRAYIRNDGRNIHLGVFASLDDAASARKIAEKCLGYHKNHGRVS